MCDIYEAYFICIAALRASRSSKGLFGKHDPMIYAPCSLFPPSTNIQVCAHPKHKNWHTNNVWPLHQRAWVLQERFLPLRILGFGPFLS